jgi:LPXTG-motif cell wall-anchored protein
LPIAMGGLALLGFAGLLARRSRRQRLPEALGQIA